MTQSPVFDEQAAYDTGAIFDDALIAVHLFNYRQVPGAPGLVERPPSLTRRAPPAYSTDPTAHQSLLRKLPAMGYTWSLLSKDGVFTASIRRGRREPVVTCAASTRYRALAKAVAQHLRERGP